MLYLPSCRVHDGAQGPETALSHTLLVIMRHGHEVKNAQVKACCVRPQQAYPFPFSLLPFSSAMNLQLCRKRLPT